MPNYKLIVKQLSPLHHNGKIYQQGDTVIERIVLTNEEADIIFLRSEDVMVVPFDTVKSEEKVEGIEGKKPEEVKKKTYAQMNAKEREEFKKSKTE